MRKLLVIGVLLLANCGLIAQSTRGLLLEMKGKSDTAKMRLYTEMADSYTVEETDSAVLFYSVAVDYAQRVGDVEKQVDYLCTIGDLHKRKGGYERAIEFYNKSIDLAGQLRSSVSYLARAYQGKGESLGLLSKHQDASGAFFTSLNLYEHLEDSAMIASLMDHVGTSLYQRGDKKQALQYYRRSLRIRETTGNKLGVAKSMVQFGDVYTRDGELDSAFTAYKDAFNVALLLKDSGVINQGLIGMAKVHLQQEDWDQAYSSLVQAKQYAEKYGTRDELLDIQLLLGKVFYKRKELGKAIAELSEVYATACSLGSRSVAVSSAGMLADVYYDHSKFQKAADFLKLRNAHLDSIAYTAHQRVKNDAQVTYEQNNQRRHEEIAQKAMDLQKANEKQVIAIWWIVGLSVLGALTTILFLVIVNRRRRRINRLLKHSLRRREHLLKEFHYRVKNNLQLVYSLLNLQKSGIKDKQAAQALGEAQNRIRSMGMVHENLYTGTQLGHVDFQQYLKLLLDALKNEYLDDRFEVDVQVNASEISMSSDKAIPVGLIINELASNAFKFAYSETEKGLLQVDLVKQGKDFQLSIRDNGPGLGEGFTIDSVQTLGLELVQILALQLGGEVHYRDDNGAVFEILITGSGAKDQE